MAVQAHKPEVLELIAEDAEVERLGTGFTFTEGPLWHPDGYLLFSDMPGDVRRRWDEESGVTEVANPSNKGNGMTWDLDGRLLVCEHVTSSLVRMNPDGTGSGREALATHYDGRELNSPNDVIVKSDGSIYFTDPTYGRMPGFGLEREQELDFQGVYRLPAGGGELELVVDDFAQPNGLCFTADESLLYINDTDRAHIRVFEVGSDGSLSGGDVLADGIGTGELESGELVDGMKLDEPGNIWVTGPKGVWVFSPEGEHLGVLEVPENVGNLNWGGPDWDWLFIPASTSMYRVQTKVSGNRLPYMR
ncbi:MAG TPA: SMP-30/gluconolactonase/LRE family protein [Solirubrobacteraceae bacterium]|nr:SMP-30/gluconolactonase/LRE family protein [Solirubrobacteraceae bacterium]